MAKKYKIKRYKTGKIYSAGPRPVNIILFILALASLVFIGISAYKPVAEFLTALTEASSQHNLPQVDPNSIGESSQEASSQAVPEPEPEPPPEVKPISNIRAVYMPLEQAREESAWGEFVKQLPADINTVIIEAKNAAGEVLFASQSERANKWAAVSQSAVDIKPLAEFLKENELYLAVRMSAFSDPIAARGDIENNAIRHYSGVMWLDNSVDRGGKPWLNPYSPQARDYIKELAQEVSSLGAAYILFDNMQFPQDLTGAADYGDTAGISKQQLLSEFCAELSQGLAENKTKLGIYLPAGALDVAITPYNQACFGGNPAETFKDIAVQSIMARYLPAGENLAARMQRAVENTKAALGEDKAVYIFLADETITAQMFLEAAKDIAVTDIIFW